MNVVVAGGSGLVGRRLVARLLDRGDLVTVVSRDPAGAQGQARPNLSFRGWLPDLSGQDAVVNLAGANIFGRRWDADYKREIRDSRVDTTGRIVAAIADAVAPPKVLVNASAVGYYGNRGDEQLTEDSAPGDDFLARVCVDWEAAAAQCPVRTVRLRTGVVLGDGGGALARMLPPFNLGLGGPIGSGSQHMAWIHIDDLCGLIVHALDTTAAAGPVNATAPGVPTNKAFSRALGRVLRRPAIFPVPALALRLAFGEVAQVLTASTRCVPEAATRWNYAFAYPDVEPALANLLGRATGAR